MAKFKPGPMVGSISGKLGNVVFTRGRYGAVIRTRTIPTLVQTDYTQEARGRLAALSQSYGGLTAAQKEAWRTWAQVNPVKDRLGDSLFLQPSAAFIQLNANIQKAGGSQISDPPVINAPDAITGMTVVATDAPDSDVAWTSGALAETEVLFIWAAVIDNPGRDYYRNLLKLVKATGAAATTPQAIEPELLLRFGTLIEGQKLVVEAEVVDSSTGLKSGRVYADCLVTAAV